MAAAGPVTLQVTMPDGKVVPVEMGSAETVKQLKAKLQALTQLAPNKQKLKHSMHGFLKDGHTADTYGFTDGEAIVVEAKTRGGR